MSRSVPSLDPTLNRRAHRELESTEGEIRPSPTLCSLWPLRSILYRFLGPSLLLTTPRPALVYRVRHTLGLVSMTEHRNIGSVQMPPGAGVAGLTLETIPVSNGRP